MVGARNVLDHVVGVPSLNDAVIAALLKYPENRGIAFHRPPIGGTDVVHGHSRGVNFECIGCSPAHYCCNRSPVRW